jgi:hypothetical protein
MHQISFPILPSENAASHLADGGALTTALLLVWGSCLNPFYLLFSRSMWIARLLRQARRSNLGSMLTWADILDARRTQLPASYDSAAMHAGLDDVRALFGEEPGAFPPALFRYLLNCAPWTYDWVAWLSGTLRRLGPTEGTRRLRARLVDPDRFKEALSVLEIADRLEVAGFQVTFDTPMMIGTSRKVPDLLVCDVGRNAAFPCEVSVQFSAKLHERSSILFDQIFEMLITQRDVPLAHAFVLLAGAPSQDRGGILNRVAWEIMEVQRDLRYREVIIDSSLRMALAPESEAERVKAWASQYGLGLGDGCALPPAVDPLKRLREKIEEEAKQLQEDGPNLLVLSMQDLLTSVSKLTDLATFLVGVLREYPIVSVLVVNCEASAVIATTDIMLDNVYFYARRRGGIAQQYLVAVNAACAHPFPADTVTRLHRAFSL